MKGLKRAYIYLASQIISIFGSGIVDYILIWYITMKSGSGLILSVSLILTYLPKILGAYFVEQKVELHKTKWVLMFSDLLTAICSTILAILIFYELDVYSLLISMIALRSIFTGIQNPCKKILLTELTPETYRVKINGYDTVISSLGSLVAPAFGAVMMVHFSMSMALMLDLVTAIAAVCFLMCLDVSFEKSNKTEKNMVGVLGKKIKIVFCWHTVFTFLIVPITFLTPLLISNIYYEDITKLAYNEMAYSLGAIAGGLCVNKIASHLKKNREFPVIAASVSACIVMLSYCVKWFPTYCAMMFLGALFINIFQIQVITKLQKESCMENRTLVFSRFEILTNIALPVGMLLWGSVSDDITIQKSLFYSGIGLLGVALIGKIVLKLGERQLSYM